MSTVLWSLNTAGYKVAWIDLGMHKLKQGERKANGPVRQ
jgi:hypothetical protein